MNTKSSVAIVRAKRYDARELKPLIKRSFDLIGGLDDLIKRDMKVFVKINHLSPPSPADRGIVTHPIFAEAVLEILKVTGADITVGDDIEEDGVDGFDISGYREMCERLGIKLVNLREEGFIPTKTAGKILLEIYLSRVALEADVIIGLAKFKTHSLTLFTGGIKNMYGVIPVGMRRRFHGDYVRPEDFCQMLVDIFAASKPQITLMDGIMAMEGEGPGSGRMKNLGVILASRDTVALDTVAANIIGIRPDDVLTTAFAAARKLGTADLNDIDILGEKIGSVAIKNFKLPANVSRSAMKYIPRLLVKFGINQISPRPHIKQKKCTACGACQQVCPTEAARVLNKYARIDYKKCIRCMCCHEVCRYDAIVSRRPFFGQSIYGIITAVRKVAGK